MKDVDVQVSQLAATQHGLVTNRQVRALGLTPRQIDRRREVGELVLVHRGVYRVAASPSSWEQTVTAACLAARGVASHRSAARLWDMRGVDPHGVEITVPTARWPRLVGVSCHSTDHLPSMDVTMRRRVPVTAPERTLLDLGAVAAPLVEAALDDALVRRLVTLASMERRLDVVGGRGRRGTAVLRRLMDARRAGQRSTESPLEDALVRLLRRHGAPEPVRQHAVHGPAGQELRIDLAYPELKLGIEADGRIWHSGRGDFQRDRVRGNTLAALGWTILRYTWGDVRARSDQVGTEVLLLRRVLSRRAS